MKTPTNTNTVGISILLLVFTVFFLSCSGCRSGKATKSADVSLPDKVSNTGQVVMQADTTPTSTTSGNNGMNTYEQPGNIALLPADDSVVDAYNVRKYILEFRSPATHEVIKTIDLVKENPFHSMGLKRRKEPYPAVYYFLMPEGADNKNALKKFLPKETFKEIPNDFELDRAISKIFVSETAGKYVTVSYELDWLPDAYSDDGEWDGPGYGVHYAVVYDSLGNKIYSRQFDGTSQMPSVSEDGKYLFTMACLSPEWDENIRYRFTVVNIQTDKIVYEELIDNCKKHGGGGEFYPEFYNANGYYAILKGEQIKRFSWRNSHFYTFLDSLRFSIISKSINEVIIKYPNGYEEVKSLDSLFTIIKLD
ncbi:MAG TPA: hypothetical protein PK611_02075 [Saprospiraceae bacterium]|nr:hypothetical protein [Saprospiraceae bacterium]HRO08517.1 hypothetical protein [Saprospiraceae bacterium]HRO72438.1 hypothetical protein [Saprospiraceae bacterium]HRP41903.1 hypothetical protein [Saprospiraceae bacterium]